MTYAITRYCRGEEVSIYLQRKQRTVILKQFFLVFKGQKSINASFIGVSFEKLMPIRLCII